MSAAKNSASAKAASLASRAQEIVFKEVSIPSASENFESAYKESSGIKTGTTNRFTVHVLPNFLAILLFIMYNVQQNISFLEPKSHAKVSSMTFIAYCLTIVYGHLLLTDMHVNPDKSRFAEEIENDTVYRDFADFLLGLPVPAFLEPVLKYFTTTTSARRRNVWFSYSPAGFNHFMDFGRFFPINIFTALHDFAAVTNSRTDPNTVRFEFNQLEVFTIEHFLARNQSITYKIANFFASYFQVDNAPHFLANKVNQALESIFNPVLLRAQQQRQTFSEIDLLPPKFKNANYNPYLAFFCLSKSTAPELRTLLSTFKSILNGTIPCKTTLAGIFKDYSGVSILTHGYSVFPLPTWNADYTVNESDRRARPLSDEEYAKLILFKRDYSEIPAAAKTRVTQALLNTKVTIRPGLPAEPPRTITVTPDAHTYLISETDTGPSDVDDVNNFTSGPFHPVSYNTERDFYPIVKILNPVEDDTVSAWMTTLCGMIIEADDLAGSAVPHPHPDARVEEDNAQFAMSAIQFRHVHRATEFRTRNPSFSVRVLPTRPTTGAPTATTMLRSLTNVFLPYLSLSRIHFGYDRLHFGLTHASPVSVPHMLQTFLGYTIRNKSTTAADPTKHEPANTPYGRLLVFSPYTYVSPAANRDWDYSNQDDAMKDYYFITNLRTIFGTDATLMELNHPLFAMPIA